MDNIGDWLYIVLLVIAGASSLISSAKKKKEQNTTPQPAKNTSPKTEMTTPVKGFWETFEEELKPKEISAPKRAKQTKTMESKKKASPFLETEKNFASSIIPTSSNNILLDSIDDDNSPIFNEEDLHNTEGIKKGVIYAEILNRRY